MTENAERLHMIETLEQVDPDDIRFNLAQALMTELLTTVIENITDVDKDLLDLQELRRQDCENIYN